MLFKKKKTNKFNCPKCGEHMKSLSDSDKPIYVCKACGCSITDNNEIINNKQRAANDLFEKQNLLEPLFSDAFMKKYTEFHCFEDFINECPYIESETPCATYKDIEHIPKRKLNGYVKIKTKFNTWDDMFETAVESYLKM